MAKKPKTLTADGTGVEAARMLEDEFIRQMIEVYRTDHPQSGATDADLYEQMRRKFHAAFSRLEFDRLENLPTAKALNLLLGGKTERAGKLLEEHFTQQRLVKQGEIHGKRSKAGNEAQAMARLAELPEPNPLKQTADIAERNRLIRERAQQLKREHPNLKTADIKRRLGEWACMSSKQIGRILRDS
jgi:hypothetical protein